MNKKNNWEQVEAELKQSGIDEENNIKLNEPNEKRLHKKTEANHDGDRIKITI